MKLTGRQVAALRGLVESGVISDAQGHAVRVALEPGSGTRSERLVEVLGYVGGGLLLGGAALVVGTSWDDLSRLGRFWLVAAATVVLVIAGGAIARGADGAPARQRIAGTLLALGSGTAAFAGAVAVDRYEVSMGGAVGLVLAALGYVLVSTAFGVLACAVQSVVLVMAVFAEVFEASALTMGIAVFALGAVWFGLALVVSHRELALGLAAAIAFFGAQQPIGSTGASWAYTMTAALGLVCFVVYLRERAVVLLVAGVVATTVVVPEAVWDWTDGAVGGGWSLLVGGTVLLAASGVGLRLRRTAGDDDAAADHSRGVD